MKDKYNSVEDLKADKEALQSDIENLEKLMTFQNPKETLGVITNGYTDNLLKQIPNDKGGNSLVLDRNFILGAVSEFIKSKVNKNTLMEIATTKGGGEIAQNLTKLAISYIITNYIQKRFGKSSWKGKALGMALMYFSPIILKFIKTKIDDYQKRKTTESLSQLI